MSPNVELAAAVVAAGKPETALYCGPVASCLNWLKARDWKRYDIREALTDGKEVLLGDYLSYELEAA